MTSDLLVGLSLCTAPAVAFYYYLEEAEES